MEMTNEEWEMRTEEWEIQFTNQYLIFTPDEIVVFDPISSTPPDEIRFFNPPPLPAYPCLYVDEEGIVSFNLPPLPPPPPPLLLPAPPPLLLLPAPPPLLLLPAPPPILLLPAPPPILLLPAPPPPQRRGRLKRAERDALLVSISERLSYWRVDDVRRQSGALGGRYSDKYYYNYMEDKKFRSLREVERYFETGELPGYIPKKKRPRPEAN